jgi:hypothetical protein
MSLNFTPIDELIRQIKKTSYEPPLTKETEPPSRPEQEQKEARVVIEHKELDEEVKPHVQVREETMEVPPDLQQMGVAATPTTHFQTQQVTTTLIPDEKIVEGLHQPVSSSFRWLAELALYILKHAHITLKKVHGKIMRVVKD